MTFFLIINTLIAGKKGRRFFFFLEIPGHSIKRKTLDKKALKRAKRKKINLIVSFCFVL